MPSFKCPACGQRHFQTVPKCLNCGTSFAAATAPAQHTAATAPAQHAAATAPARQRRVTGVSLPKSDPVNDDDIAEFESLSAEVAQQQAVLQAQEEEQPDQLDDNTVDSEPDSPQSVSPAPSRQLVRRQMDVQQVPRQSWKKQTAIQTYNEPYDTDLQLAPSPFSMPGFGGVSVTEERVRTADPEYWKTDKLPWWYRRIKPNIAGSVIHMESKEEVVDYPDILAAVATLLVELIWVLPNVQENKEADRIVMTTIRVRTYDGTLKDARLRGNMRGANLSLGDEISLWGAKRHGIVVIHRGFNHTTKGVVFTRAVGMFVPAIIAILCVVGAIYFLPSWGTFLSHMIGSTFGPFFTFFRTHPSIIPMQKKK